MFWGRHHPLFRRVLLTVNLLLPLVVLAAWVEGLAMCTLALAAVAIGSHLLLLIAVLHPHCPWLGPVIRSFKTDRRAVWLTIDDGPGAQSAQLAEELRARGVCATFFVIGDKVTGPAALAMLAAGHTLGNHTQTHPRATMWMTHGRRLQRELDGGAEALECDAAKHFFRPPVGHKPPGLHPALAARGWPCVMWTTGGRDGWAADPSPLVARILAAVEPGAIILLHEGRPHSLRTILTVVDALLPLGYEFVIPTHEELREACIG